MFLFIIAILILLAGCVVGGAMMADGAKSGVATMVGGIIIGLILCIASCVATVPTGHTGVVTTFGRVENTTLDSGVHFKAPWQKVVTMDNRVQKQTVDLVCFSSDIQEVSMIYTINYQISKADAMTIYSTIGVGYYETVVTPSIAESVKIVAAGYTAEELVGMRSELAAEIESDLSDKLLPYNIEVVSTSIEDMDFTDAFTDAVEAKQVAQQDKLRAETEAEQQVIEAQAAADVQRIEADAAAYETVARAEAEAEANQKVAESITDGLIQYRYAEAWDGKLPTFMASDSSGIIPVIDATAGAGGASN